jgi:hypothetical protein
MKPDQLQMESNACLNRFFFALQNDNSSLLCPILNSLFLIIKKRNQYTDSVLQSILDFSKRPLNVPSLKKKFIQKTLKNVLLACITLPRAAGFVNEIYDTLISLGASHREIQFRQRKGRVMEEEEEVEFEPETKEEKQDDDIQKQSLEFLEKVKYDQVPFPLILEIIFTTLQNRDPFLFDQDVQNLIGRMLQEEEVEETVPMQVDQTEEVVEEEEEVVENDIDIESILNQPLEIPTEMKEQLVHDSMNRILGMLNYFDTGVKANYIPKEQDTLVAAKYGWILVVSRMMTRSSCGNVVQKDLFKFIFEDFSARMDIAIFWLFEEYVSSDQYSSCLQQMLDYIKGNDSFEGLDPKDRSFTKFLVEVPDFADIVMKRILEYCEDEKYMQLGIYTLRDLIVYRPAVREECLKHLLNLGCGSNAPSRILAVQALLKFSKHEIALTIVSHAKSVIRELLQCDEQENKTELNQFMNSRMDLYIGLCLSHHDLLTELFTLSHEFPKHVLEHLCLALHPLFQEMLSEPDILFQLLETHPPDALEVTLVLVRTLLQSDLTHDRALKLFIVQFQERSYDVRFLLLIVHELPKNVILKQLPLLVDGMTTNKDPIKNAIIQMVSSPNEDQPPKILPSEWIISVINLPEAHVKGMMEGLFC